MKKQNERQLEVLTAKLKLKRAKELAARLQEQNAVSTKPKYSPEVIRRYREMEEQHAFTRQSTKRAPVDLDNDDMTLSCGHRLKILASLISAAAVSSDARSVRRSGLLKPSGKRRSTGGGNKVAQTSEEWWIVGAIWAASLLFLGFIYLLTRKWNPKAMVKRRLLVKEDGQFVWRAIRGKCLIGWPNPKSEISSGEWTKTVDAETGEWDREWTVIQADKGKFVVYRFDKRVDDEPRTGAVLICDSWRDLESALPPDIFERALLGAGFKKPSQYREVPLQL